jgi:SWIB/MDM2 domain
VIRKLWAYIKANGLQDSVNKRAINADAPPAPDLRQAAGDDVRARHSRWASPLLTVALERGRDYFRVTKMWFLSLTQGASAKATSGEASQHPVEPAGWLRPR